MAPTTSESGRAFLAFTLGPVQSFIAAARSVRDLWTGSFLLSWLTYEAMAPVRDCPEARIVSPGAAEELGQKSLLSPDLPNRFVADVPATQAAELARACRDACHDEWLRIATAVRRQLSDKVREKLDRSEGWSRLWDAQVESFFDIRTAVLPWSDADEKTIHDLLPEEKRCKSTSPEERLWTDRFELTAALLAAGKLIRAPINYRPESNSLGQYPAKCSLLGTYEQMGPAELRESATFWEQFAKEIEIRGSRTRARERLCAVSLVKRFAWPAYFATETDARPDRLRFDDTATVAAARWLREASEGGFRHHSRRDWSGQWLHWSRPDMDEDEPCPEHVFEDIRAAKDRERAGAVPTYYAILMLDGDKMGDKFRSGAGAEHHRRISEALSKFARNRVRSIVEKDHEGSLIYAGGDDVLAVLPTATALACALTLARAFRENWDKHGLPEPDTATVSAGLAVVHYKEDLRFALGQARAAETRSKREGRNRLTVTICRRSGEHTSAGCPWDFVEQQLIRWVEGFLQRGVSDRWAYHLAADLPVLRGLEPAAITAEIQRQIGRAEKTTQARFDPKSVAAAFNAHATDRPVGDRIHSFVTLCQTASFLARGRDA